MRHENKQARNEKGGEGRGTRRGGEEKEKKGARGIVGIRRRGMRGT